MKFSAIVLALSVLFTQNSFAKCEDVYTRKINETAGRMNPARTTVIINLGAEAAVVGALSAAGTAITVGAVVGLPAAALGAGAYLTTLSLQKKSYTRALLALKQAEAGEGPVFNLLVNRINNSGGSFDRESIRQVLLRLNAEKAFCSENPENGKVTVSYFKKMEKQVLAEL